MAKQRGRERPSLAELAHKVLTALSGDPKARSKATAFMPIKAIDGPLLFSQRKGAFGERDDGWWVYFTLQSVSSYPYRKATDQRDIQARLDNLFTQLEGCEGHLVSVPYELQAEGLMGDWTDSLHDTSTEQGKRGRAVYLEKVAANVDQMQSEDYRIAVLRIGIRLNDRDYPGSVRDIPEGVTPEIAAQYGIQSEECFRLVPRVAELLGMIQTAGFEHARPVGQDELLNLVQRTMWPGCPKRPEMSLPNDTPLFDDDSVANLATSTVLEHSDHLEFTYFDQTTFASFLSLARLPHEPASPGCEYLWAIDKYGDALAISVRFKVISAGAIHAETIKTLSDVEDHAAVIKRKNKDAGQRELARASAAIMAKQDQVANELPIVRFRATVCITSDNLSMLEELVRDFIQKWKKPNKGGRTDQRVIWTVPVGFQLPLYNESVPGSNVKNTRTFSHDASPDSVAAGAIHVSAWARTPTPTPPWIGKQTGPMRSPFFYSPFMSLDPNIDAGTAIMIVGLPGGGKSNLGLSLAVWAAMYGAVALVREGTKGDFRKFRAPHGLEVHEVAFDAFEGGLNPGLLGTGDEENAQLLADWLYKCCKTRNDSWQGALYIYAEKEILANREAPDYRNVIDALLAQPGMEHDIGLDLSPIRNLKAGKACYGNSRHSQELISKLGPGLSVWRAESWSFPHVDTPRSDWTPLQLFSAACVGLTFELGRAVARKRNLRVFMFDDEVQELGATEVMHILEETARFGRSQNAAAAVATHTLQDVPDRIKKLVGTIFIFRLADEDVVRAAELLGLDSNDPAVLNEIRLLGRDESGVPLPEYKGEFFARLPDGTIVKARLLLPLWLGEDGLVTNEEASAHHPALERVA